MPNENDHVEIENNEEELDLELDLESEVEPEKEAPKEKRKFSPEEQLAIHERQAKKIRKELGINPEESRSKSEDKTSKSSDLDYGQKAFLKTYGIQGSDELALVKTFATRTGDDLDTIVSDDIFLAKLTNLREARESADAIPKSTRRSSAPVGDDLSVALTKYRTSGELPQDRTLREKVVDAQLVHERTGNAFSDTGIINSGQAI